MCACTCAQWLICLYTDFSLLTCNMLGFYYTLRVFLTLTFSIRLISACTTGFHFCKNTEGVHVHRHTNKIRQVHTILMVSVSREITAGFYFLLYASKITLPPVSISCSSNSGVYTHTRFFKGKRKSNQWTHFLFPYAHLKKTPGNCLILSWETKEWTITSRHGSKWKILIGYGGG